MIKTIIIDDEQHCIDRLSDLIKTSPISLDIVATCTTVEEAVKKTKQLLPQLVLLDIEIHDQTGFEYLQQLDNYNFAVVFTTAFENYAIKAIKFSAFDYLLKPIDAKDFYDTINRLQRKKIKPNIELQIETLLHNLDARNHKKHITIPSNNGFEVLKMEDIIRCQADASYTSIHTLDRSFVVSKPLKYYENLLNTDYFFRVHNSHLININYIKKYTKGKGGYVTMINNVNIDVSIRRKDDFLKLLAH